MRDDLTRALARAPGWGPANAAALRDRRFGGGLLAGALAFRLFGALLPLGLLVAIALGYAAEVDRTGLDGAADTLGIGRSVLESIAQSSRLSTGTRWTVAAFGVFALISASVSAARAIRSAHSLAWAGGVEPLRRPIAAGLVLVAVLVGFGSVWVGLGAARAGLGAVWIVLAFAATVVFFAMWLAVAALLPHGDAPWTALAPGALVVAIGVQALHLATVLFVAERLERASATYGSFGVAFTILLWLYVLSRVIVASAMLNAALWQRRRAGRTGDAAARRTDPSGSAPPSHPAAPPAAGRPTPPG